MKYYIGNPLFGGPVYEVEYDYPPPCLYCNNPVIDESTDGPLVCAWCDCGHNRDGTPWTWEQNRDAHANFKARIQKDGKLLKTDDKTNNL